MHDANPNSLGTGIRQRNIHANLDKSASGTDDDDQLGHSSHMSTLRAVILIVSVLGVSTFSSLAMVFGARYAFVGFHGNMEDAANSCWQTAALFAIVALISAFPSLTSAFYARSRAHALHKKYTLPTTVHRQ